MLLLATAAALAVVGPAATAHADVTCAYTDEGLPLLPQGNVLTVNLSDDNEGATVRRSGSAIKVLVNDFDDPGAPVACSGTAPTVTNIDTIKFTAPSSADETFADIDLGGGPLAPGATNEGNGSSEIEIAVDMKGDFPFVGIEGSRGSDHLVLGRNGTVRGANLNAGLEGLGSDVDLTGLREGIFVNGGRGHDRITLNGGPGFSRPLTPSNASEFEFILVLGGRGNDVITGGPAFDLLDGGPGRDTLRGLGSPDFLFGGRNRDRLYGGTGSDIVDAYRHGRDKVFCGKGHHDLVFADRHDRLSSCENVERSSATGFFD